MRKIKKLMVDGNYKEALNLLFTLKHDLVDKKRKTERLIQECLKEVNDKTQQSQ